MIISFEASANVDTTLFGYFSFQYDPEFFSDIRENITEISKNGTLSFPVDLSNVRLVFAEYHSVRKMLKLTDIEQNKFTDVYKGDFNHKLTKRFQSVKLNIDKDYFFFTGTYAKSKYDLIQFQSLNFDLRFIDTLEKHYKTVVN